jgi:hypothetical protein
MDRAKNKKTRRDKIYDSLGQAAAALRIPKWILSSAKARGCDAFTGSRVDAAKIRSWLAKHGSELESSISPVQAAILQRIQLQCQRLEFDLAIERGEYLPRADVINEINAANGTVMREIRRALECDLPPRLEGLCAIEIKRVLRRKFDSIFEHLHKGFAAAAAKQKRSDAENTQTK